MVFGRKNKKVVPFRTAGELDAMAAAGAVVGRRGGAGPPRPPPAGGARQRGGGGCSFWGLGAGVVFRGSGLIFCGRPLPS